MAVPSLNDLVKKANELQMMPQTARKVMEMMSNESTTADQLASVIEKDANITTRILKISNSAFYGLRSKVTTVQHAIMVLGYKSVRSLVVASSSQAMHKRFGITEQMMWDQSVGTAICGRMMSEGLPKEVSELAFVGGLLHNVGKAIMNNECPKEYTEVMKLVYNDGMDSPDAEQEVFNYSYPEVGFRITEDWGLPPSIGKIIRFHRLSKIDEAKRNEVLQEDSDLQQALACVEVGCEMCRVLGIGYKGKQLDIGFEDLPSAKILQLNPERWDALKEKFEKTYESEKAVFS